MIKCATKRTALLRPRLTFAYQMDVSQALAEGRLALHLGSNA